MPLRPPLCYLERFVILGRTALALGLLNYAAEKNLVRVFRAFA